MTLNAHKVLEQYFHTIINQPPLKETTMFERSVEKTKMFFNEQIEHCVEKLNSLLTKPTAFVEEETHTPEIEDIWGFEMYTGKWEDELGQTQPAIHTWIQESHEGTWMEVLDTILDAMEEHYGYSIKEQVYYSVNFPLNQSDLHGYGRCLNDERLQQILLAFPELYLSGGWSNSPEREAMFK